MLKGAAEKEASELEKEYASLLGEAANEAGDEEAAAPKAAPATSFQSSYTQQLLLSALSALASRISGASGLDEVLDVAVVVAAVQLARDTAERSAALKLLSCLAEAAPDGTLKNVFEVRSPQ